MLRGVLAAQGEFRLEQVPRPEPGADQVLLQVVACGLCASDLDVWLGRNPWQQYPAWLGHEVVGRVATVGAGAARWQEEALVAAPIAAAGYADYVVVQANHCLPVSEGLAADAALAEPLSCAVNAVRAVAAAPADRVVVLGAGFQGLLLIQLLARVGLRWLVVAARRPEARALALAHGATHACAFDEVQRCVRELTDGEGADVVIEATGSEEALAIAASLCRVEGTLAIVGYHLGSGRRVPIHEWNWKALRVVNAHVRSHSVIMDGARRGLQLAHQGDLAVAPLITHRFPLTQLQEAFAAAAARAGGYVKAVVEPGR